MNALQIEILANALNLICVVLILFNKPSNWIFGIANSIVFIAVFIPAKLYGDASLQVMYASLSAYGLYQWLFGNGGIKANRKGIDTNLPISNCTSTKTISFLELGIVLTIVFAWFLSKYTNTDVASYDAILTSMSVVATIMMAKRITQHWYVWITTNVLYFALYAHKTLYITMWCQVPLAIVSYFGLQYWLKEYYEQSTTVR
jgi:nicotinamide mononucleotide transporter